VAGGGEQDVDVRRLVGKRLTELVDELERYDPLVRADVPDAVHSMRVTIRRLRSNLATFGPLLDRDVTEPLRDELKWFGALLGEARDAEVLRAGLLSRLSDDPPHLVGGDVTMLVDDELASRYRDAHLRCVEVMAGARYAALGSRLGALRDSPSWAAGPTPRPEVLRKRVRRDWDRLRRRVAAHSSTADDESQAAQLHEVRKAAKRVRYAVEPLVASYGEPAERLTDQMKQVQTILGEHQDAVVALQVLLVLSERAGDKGIDAFELGRLHEQEQEVARETARTFATVWEEASRKRYRSWL
jgi:CHAD domain-containing protein